jgi:hypothetical protein
MKPLESYYSMISCFPRFFIARIKVYASEQVRSIRGGVIPAPDNGSGRLQQSAWIEREFVAREESDN